MHLARQGSPSCQDKEILYNLSGMGEAQTSSEASFHSVIIFIAVSPQQGLKCDGTSLTGTDALICSIM